MKLYCIIATLLLNSFTYCHYQIDKPTLEELEEIVKESILLTNLSTTPKVPGKRGVSVDDYKSGCIRSESMSNSSMVMSNLSTTPKIPGKRGVSVDDYKSGRIRAESMSNSSMVMSNLSSLIKPRSRTDDSLDTGGDEMTTTGRQSKLYWQPSEKITRVILFDALQRDSRFTKLYNQITAKDILQVVWIVECKSIYLWYEIKIGDRLLYLKLRFWRPADFRRPRAPTEIIKYSYKKPRY